jgi:hypothetical protein
VARGLVQLSRSEGHYLGTTARVGHQAAIFKLLDAVLAVNGQLTQLAGDSQVGDDLLGLQHRPVHGTDGFF